MHTIFFFLWIIHEKQDFGISAYGWFANYAKPNMKKEKKNVRWMEVVASQLSNNKAVRKYAYNRWAIDTRRKVGSESRWCVRVYLFFCSSHHQSVHVYFQSNLFILTFLVFTRFAEKCQRHTKKRSCFCNSKLNGICNFTMLISYWKKNEKKKKYKMNRW